jgi:hypothetical protein
MASAKRNELIHRLLAGRCELCEGTETLVICRRCHEDIHAGRATKPYPK